MCKNVFTLILALLTNSLFGQQNTLNDYKIYSSLVNAEITSETKSVIIVNKLKNDTSSIQWITEAIKLKDPISLEEVRFLTRDEKGNHINNIDSTIQNLILNFYQTQLNDIVLQNKFDIPSVKVLLIDNFPIKKGTQAEWKRFHKKHPDSGIFEFSNIFYSQDNKEAIFYNSLFRNGLNARGALTIMKNLNGEWKIKCNIILWQA